jgi:hypothetical protein
VKPLRHLLAGGAALVALSLTATACDASPFAARVNSQVIKETALNVEARAWAGNTAYVSAYNSSNSTGNGGTGGTVAGEGPGTYSTAWVANILDGMVAADVVHQQLAATGRTPTPAIEAASQSVNEIAQPGWDRFSASFRQTLVSRLADEAALTPSSESAATLLPLYDHYKSSFFTQICTVQASAFASAQAQSLATTGLPNGTPACYTQTQFEAQTAAVQTALTGTALGKAVPIKTSYGYLVLKVVSRQTQPFSADLQRVLSIVTAQGPNPALTSLLAKARVQINPAYGTWKSSQVMPPTDPSATT